MIYKPTEAQDPEEEEREDNDFFETPPPPRREVPKEPELKPDDPGYWDNEESQWSHLDTVRRRTWRWAVLAVVVVAGCLAVWLRYLSPCVDSAVQFGYVDHIERRGTVFKTYEGVLIPYKELMDTTRLYQRDFVFTAADEKVATKLLAMQIGAKPVRVSYRRYHATLPWRGASKTVITAVDSVDPSDILPAAFNPLHRDNAKQD